MVKLLDQVSLNHDTLAMFLVKSTDMPQRELQEVNLRSQQRKLLDHIAAAGFSQDIVEYVRTWRILALGPHEYSYTAPRRLGKQRSMKGVQQVLYHLQQQPFKLKEGGCALVWHGWGHGMCVCVRRYAMDWGMRWDMDFGANYASRTDETKGDK